MDEHAVGQPRRAARSPAALVETLWRTMPPAGWRGAGAGGAVLAALARVGTRAARLAARGPADGRPAARLLAETARAVGEVWEGAEPGGGGLGSPARRRLARMERWLAGRAAGEPAAGPAADLCLWALEHLERAETAGEGPAGR